MGKVWEIVSLPSNIGCHGSCMEHLRDKYGKSMESGDF